MLPPNFEICFEGYNTEQVDFYLNQLIEKLNSTANLYEKSLSEIKRLEEENNNLRKDFISLVSQFNSWSELQQKLCSVSSSLDEIKTALNIESKPACDDEEEDVEFESELVKEPVKAESALMGEVETLQLELSSLKEFLKK